jgi:hypothetical protein
MFNACDDDYFTKNPQGNLNVNGYWNTEADIKSWMAGTYSGIQQTLGENLIYWGEARSDDFYPTIYGGDQWQFNAVLPTSGQCSWENLYKVIARCNGGLENIDRVKNVPEANMPLYKGQLYAIRAFMYFYAIRVWGDVPLILQTWDGTASTKYNPRTPISEIKTQIQKDIDMAVELLIPDVSAVTSGNANCFYFNKSGALALKMDIHLWFKEYQPVVDASQFIMDTKRYSLVTSQSEWRDIFLKPNVSKETIFTMDWLYPENDRNPYGALLSASDKNPTFCVSHEVFGLMLRGDKKDVRFWGVIDTLKIYNDIGKVPIDISAIVIGSYIRGDKVNKFYEMTANTYGFTAKGQGQCDFKLPIYRYADVLLMRAEALNKLDRGQEALDIVNDIRKRCGNDDVADISFYTVQDGYAVNSRERCILEERQVEFYGEGKRWFDLRRTGEIFYTVMNYHLINLQNYRGLDPIGFPANGRELFPLYYQVFAANPLLVGHQNPPYSE